MSFIYRVNYAKTCYWEGTLILLYDQKKLIKSEKENWKKQVGSAYLVDNTKLQLKFCFLTRSQCASEIEQKYEVSSLNLRKNQISLCLLYTV